MNAAIDTSELLQMLANVRDERARLNVTVGRLREAVSLYAKHLHDCGHFTEDGVCTCGLEEVRAL